MTAFIISFLMAFAIVAIIQALFAFKFSPPSTRRIASIFFGTGILIFMAIIYLNSFAGKTTQHIAQKIGLYELHLATVFIIMVAGFIGFLASLVVLVGLAFLPTRKKRVKQIKTQKLAYKAKIKKVVQTHQNND